MATSWKRRAVGVKIGSRADVVTSKILSSSFFYFFRKETKDSLLRFYSSSSSSSVYLDFSLLSIR